MAIDLTQVSCCLNTKEATYPKEILDHVSKFPFGEILILTHSDSPYRKHELFAKAKYPTIYYQDDDAICPIQSLVELSEDNIINLAIKESHFEAHKNNRSTMGLGWGAVFPKSLLLTLQKYVKIYGEDEVYQRETERIFTYLNFPQNRLILPIQDLPSAWAEDRLWRQPDHNRFKQIAEERCHGLISDR
jgi:hypothetical protein